MSISYRGYRTGFPFRILTKNADGGPIALWDGATSWDYQPSSSSSKFLAVVGPGTSYPFGFTLPKIAELIWRTRRINVSIDVSYSRTMDNGYFQRTTNVSYSPEGIRLPRGRNGLYDWVPPGIFVTAPDTDPIESICFRNNGSRFTSNLSYWGVYEYETIDVYESGTVVNSENYNGVISIGAEPSYRCYLAEDGLYYPYIYATINSILSTKKSVDPYYPGVATDATFSFPGFSPIPLYIDTAYNSISQSATGSIVMTNESYFPYGDKWNTSTGAPV